MRAFLRRQHPALTASELTHVRAVSGPSLRVGMRDQFPGAEIRESVLLRDPTGVLLSLYNRLWLRYEEGWGREPPPFERWYPNQFRNPVSRFLLSRYFGKALASLYRLSSLDRLRFLERQLARFHFVGGVHMADQLIRGVAQEMGLSEEITSQNVAPRRRVIMADLTPEMCRRIERDNALDQALFDRWAERGWDGAPSADLPGLSSTDQPRLAAGDLGAGIRGTLFT